MSRYIDADKLKEHKFVGVQFDRYSRMVSDGRAKAYDEIYAYKVGYNEAIDNIADFEPTADVVEAVRCKECKYGIDWDGRLSCEWHGFYQTEPHWFCADGERRENGQTLYRC